MVEDIRNLAACKNKDELFDGLCSIASGLGFEFVVFAGVIGDDSGSSLMDYPFVLSSYPVEWRKRYTEHAYHEIDPVVNLTPVTSTTLHWGELRDLKSDFFDEASSFGLRTGFSIPIQVPRRVYLFSFATARDEVVSEDTQAALEGQSFVFIQAYMRRFSQAQTSVSLHDKTLKILHMSLAGVSTVDIADSLGITVHGVSWHLREAREKLHCQTTLQACGKALALGLITL